MKELTRTNDIVLLSYLEHRLREAGIEALTLDTHTSIVEGSLGILPRRIMVGDDDLGEAERILDDVRRLSRSGQET
ncbi:MAG: DUF2007 domain-containing protein [Parvibaculum sp.]|uniref:putative signal transducing protein n=1 Tax=Parvibaculum sp. TaxID=2024848 RepID=UPI003C70A382